MATEQSSIQRFLQNRAPQILVGAYSKNGYVWQIAAGAFCFFVGGSLLLAGLISGYRALNLASIGPLVAGAINFYVGNRFRRKVQLNSQEARLSAEAKAFLHSLMRGTNTSWNCGWGNQFNWNQYGPANQLQNGETVFHQLGKHWGFLPKTPKDILPRPVYDILDAACYHYNRVMGISEGSRNDPGISKVSNAARAGADEAIFAVLHHAATMHKFPETIQASSRDCEEKIRGLKEIADRLESIQLRPTSIADRLGYSSAMDTALEELRLEQMAREELKSNPESSLHENA